MNTADQPMQTQASEPAKTGGGIVFGLGTGRCGTSSLASLLNGQPETVCFHEINPSAMAWSGAEATIGSLMRDFIAILGGGELDVTADLVVPNRSAPLQRAHSLPKISAIGDIGSYYLPYVPFMIDRWSGLRFPCLRRNRAEVITSFAVKLTQPASAVPRNHWSPQNDKRWRRDAIWDRCFPTFEGMLEEDLEAHIAKYYDMYYEMAEGFANQYPDHLRIFEITDLNSFEGRHSLLDFCLPNRVHVDFEVHENSGY
jgi:hypothetical protein